MLSWLLGTSFPCWKALTHEEELGAMLFSVEACLFLNVDGGGVKEEGVDVKCGERVTRLRERRGNYSQSVK